MNKKRVAARLIIHGAVQGVWYRGWAVDTASAMGLQGWVRNRRDGTVEALLIGGIEAVTEMTDRCRVGPEMASVTSVVVSPAEDDNSVNFGEKATV